MGRRGERLEADAGVKSSLLKAGFGAGSGIA